MSERIMLYLAIAAVFWVLLWLYRRENKPTEQNDSTPFAMRPSSYVEEEAGQERNKPRKAVSKQ